MLVFIFLLLTIVVQTSLALDAVVLFIKGEGHVRDYILKNFPFSLKSKWL